MTTFNVHTTRSLIIVWLLVFSVLVFSDPRSLELNSECEKAYFKAKFIEAFR